MRDSFSRLSRGFSLVELLVVIGIIAILIGALLTVLSKARWSANDVKCKSNIRQLSVALLNYAAENKNRFPPNIDFLPPPAPNWIFNNWYDVARIGKYLPRSGKISRGLADEMDRVIGGVMACPADEAGSASYGMNYFASSGVKVKNYAGAPSFPNAGQAWGPNTKQSSKLILVTEMLSNQPDGHGGYMCGGVHPTALRQMNFQSIQDVRFYPGVAFVGYGRLVAYGSQNPSDGYRYTMIDTEFDWGRHRRRGDGGKVYTESRGRANFGFADGHVEMFTPEDLAHRSSRRSKLVALWSPLDPVVNRLPIPN